MTEHRIVFTPSGREGAVADGATVLDAARQLGVDLDSVCGGRGICGRCLVEPGHGSFAKWAITTDGSELDPKGPTEHDYRGRRPLDEGARLGCQAVIRGDLIVDVPPESQLHGPVVRKSIDVGDLELDPITTLHTLTLPPAPLVPGGAEGVLAAALADQWALPDVGLAAPTLPTPGELEADDHTVTVAVRRTPAGRQISSVRAGVHPLALGIAIDVGSTTIAGHLVDLATGEVVASHGAMNPQIRLGEDLMSRVSYAMMNDGGAAELTAVVRAALGDLAEALVEQAGVSAEEVLEVVLVGNPVMHHIALGYDAIPLGQSPFELAIDTSVEVPAPHLGLACHNAVAYWFPCIAGHVGADTVAAMLAEGPHREAAVQLLVDVGTNAEIVLGNSDALYAASSPTGPAFEGAQISCGQRAVPGAIERVRIDRETLEPRFRVIGCDLWSDDPDFAAATSATGVTGICGSGIIEVLAELFLAGVIAADGTIDGDRSAETPRVVADGRTHSYLLHQPLDGASQALYITQADVRAIQLAKAALRAGIDLLVEHAAVSHIDSVRLAGAFGAHIDPLYAMVLGLVPDGPVEVVRGVGNAAGAGAVRGLLSYSQRREAEAVARSVNKIETALEPRFQELFVDAMAFPHATAAPIQLSAAVELPTPRPAARADRSGRRRGRARGGARRP